MPDSQPKNLKTLRELPRKDILFSVARMPNSDRLLVGSSEGKVFSIDASRTTGEVRELANHGRYVTAVRVVGDLAISGSYDGKLIWWDLEKNAVVRTLENAHARQVRQLAVSPDGAKLASVGDDMVCRIWNPASGERLRELKGHEEKTPTHFGSMLYACEFSRDGRYLATGDRVGHVVIWEMATGRKAGEIDVPSLYTWDGTQRIRSIGGIRALAFSPDGTELAVGGVGQINNVDALQGPSRVEIHNWAKKTKLQEFTGPQGIFNRLYWHPQNHWLCAIGGAGNGFVHFYDPVKKANLHQANMPMHVQEAAFNEDFTILYSVGHNKIVVSETKA